MPKRSPEEKELSQGEAALVLAGVLAILEKLQRLEPTLTLDGLRALLVIALATKDCEQLRLPSVTSVAREIDKSVSRGSRLIASLVDPGGPELVEGRLGISGDRSEAFVLTDQGRTLIAALLKSATGKLVEIFETQTYQNLVERRRHRDRPIVALKKVRYCDDAYTMVVTPAEDAASEEVREWCMHNLSKMPTYTDGLDGIAISFATEADAVYFRLRWC